MAKSCEHLQYLTAADFPPLKTPASCKKCLAEGTHCVALRECRLVAEGSDTVKETYGS